MAPVTTLGVVCASLFAVLCFITRGLAPGRRSRALIPRGVGCKYIFPDADAGETEGQTMDWELDNVGRLLTILETLPFPHDSRLEGGRPWQIQELRRGYRSGEWPAALRD